MTPDPKPLPSDAITKGHSKGTLLELAERCEQAAGPDRRLEIDILSALGLGVRLPGSAPDGSQDGWHNPENDPRATALWNCTASLDHAMTLVPDGWQVEVLGQQSDGQWWVKLLRPLVGDEDAGKVIRPAAHESSFANTTPALALCAAALRSRAHQ